MLLSDRDLHDAVAAGRIGVEPFAPELVQPSSLDVRLAAHFWVPDPAAGPIDPEQPGQGDWLTVPDGEPFRLQPGQFVLASTVETVRVPADVSGFVVGKSSLARHGLAVEAAGLVDAGFEGALTLELYSMAGREILLRPGLLVAQLYFLALTSPAVRPYGSAGVGRYQHQRGPTPARAATTPTTG